MTDGRGADVIYDPVGGDIFDTSMRCIAWNGRLLVIGFASGRIAEAKTNIILLKEISVVGVAWGAFAQRDRAANRAYFDDLFRWYEEGALKPRISRRLPLEEAPAALAGIPEPQRGRQAGADGGAARGLNSRPRAAFFTQRGRFSTLWRSPAAPRSSGLQYG